MKSRESITFKRLAILNNPRSSNADKVKKIIASLEEVYPGKVVTATIAKTRAQNIQLLKDLLRAGDILLICGGDGTISNIAGYLLDPSLSKRQRRTPVIAIGTGQMNDLARILNDKHSDDPLYVLKHGRRLRVHPIKCVCEPLKAGLKPLTKIAIYSLGFGYSGEGSIALNDPNFRAQTQTRKPVTRPLKFLKDGLSLLKKADFFDVTLEGERRSLLDVTAGNGHILYGYWTAPVKLGQKKFYFTTLDDRSTLNTFRTLAVIATKRPASGKVVTEARFILHESVPGHSGGEIFKPPAPCEVTISLHEEPIIMLATSPKV